ncbi:MAG: hypothetical protein AABY22_32195 [Nanoarchaeota archaeon]
MNNKQEIEVRLVETNPTTRPKYTVTKKIKRKIWAEAIGNFNPIFCRYLGKRTLVKSEIGDLSDPFRREENYLNSLFIEIKE